MPLGGGNDTRHLDHLNKSFRLDTHPSTKAHAKTRVSNHDDVIPETVEASEVDGEGEGDGSDTYHVEDEKWTPWNVLEAVKNRPRCTSKNVCLFILANSIYAGGYYSPMQNLPSIWVLPYLILLFRISQCSQRKNLRQSTTRFQKS